ncbi:MAG: 1-deoxy-D-xylulose-5-phosphate synthase, partial [Muribaculaceae bacterium]|nr:1-deoxy-D-xylulose-5-phosphate synthase [Muribaculaceae bacterium]
SNPGHFGSSMGAVELTVALHYVYDTPTDRLVWDVGHQAYSHKILTGRREAFASQRTLNGISGFPNPLESQYDTFMAGHASNSISAALGMAIADKNTPQNQNRKTVAVIGDASISGGLAFEGLNNASNNPNDLLIILNDNEMSIDDNVGALHRYLTEMTVSSRYNRLRDRVYRLFKRKGIISDTGKGRILRFNNSLKALISRRQNIFEGLNIRYFGPFDGHDVHKLVRILQEIKDMKGPRLLHLNTIKGYGFEAAENNPAAWHAPGKFDPETGEKIVSASKRKCMKWQDIFGNTLVKMADKNPDICAITAGMPSGTSVIKMMEKFPDRTFDVGISEGHAVTFAGGLAAGGKHPFVAIYSSFLQRSYDNIINDIAIQGLPVTICIDRAGLVGEDGVTHHGLFDLVYLRAIPNMTVASPMDAPSLRALMREAEQLKAPMAIRYPRGNAPEEPEEQEIFLPQGKSRPIYTQGDSDIAVISIGEIGNEAVKAVKYLREENINVHHYDLVYLKPLDTEMLSAVANRYKYLITIEDGIVSGGMGSSVSEYMHTLKRYPQIIKLGIADHWVHHGTVSELRKQENIDSEAIINTVKQIVANKL